MTLTYEDIARTMEQFAPFAPFPRPKRRELHCAADVVEALRKVAGEPEPTSQRLPARLQITGINLVVVPDFQSGEWELREDGEAVMCGRLRL